MNDDPLGPLAGDDLELLGGISRAQDALDPLPAGLLERLEFAISLELLNAELATLTDSELLTTRSDEDVLTDMITFTASSTSLMIVLSPDQDGVRIDGWVTGGGITVTLHAGTDARPVVSDATGRLIWSAVPHGPVRFLVEPVRPGGRPVVTPTIEV